MHGHFPIVSFGVDINRHQISKLIKRLQIITHKYANKRKEGSYNTDMLQPLVDTLAILLRYGIGTECQSVTDTLNIQIPLIIMHIIITGMTNAA